jgi:DNA repair ATPase RecN
MGDSLDSELLLLISRLNKIQGQVGGAKSKWNKDHDGKIDRFIDLKDQMTERLMNLKETFENIQSMEKSPGSNPKELIGEQSKVRSELAALNEEWKELDSTYRNEAKKRRSKFSAEELSHRQQILDALQLEIQRIKDIQRAGYIKGYSGVQMEKMEDSELFNPAFKVC